MASDQFTSRPTVAQPPASHADAAFLATECGPPLDTVAPGNTNSGERSLASGPAFAFGTLIATSEGEKPVQQLRAGDRLLTLDHGYRPLLWRGCARLRTSHGANAPAFVECGIASLSAGTPHRPLRITAQHRLLLSGQNAFVHTGESEVLAAARDLAGHPDIRQRPIDAGQTCYRLLMAQHEVILANGTWCESLFLSPRHVARKTDALHHHLISLTGGGHRETARLCLTRSQTALIRSRAAPRLSA